MNRSCEGDDTREDHLQEGESNSEQKRDSACFRVIDNC